MMDSVLMKKVPLIKALVGAFFGALVVHICLPNDAYCSSRHDFIGWQQD
jgi:hypothetical protein